MNENHLTVMQQLTIWFLPVLFGITVHEFAHGWMAQKLGDATAQQLGRITLNPLKHIDPIGTIFFPLILLWAGSGFIFGWAKPVPINFANLRNPRRDMMFIAAAGPIANLIMAVLWGLITKISYLILTVETEWLGVPLLLMGLSGISFNLILMVMNLLPLPPLDGGRILVGVLPESLAKWLTRYEAYIMLLLIILVTTGTLTPLMIPLVENIYSFLLTLLNLS